MLDKQTVLKQYFGHSTFRFGQEQVVDSILHKRDVLCVMPTGAGKSVCYQIPALMLGGMTIVISPLISLMKDQVNALTQNGIPAAYLNSSLTQTQYIQVINQMRRGAYKIVYVAPERLTVPDFLAACQEIQIDLLAIDEAHCISQWGQAFRPSYLKISDFVNALWYRPVIAAFTATATEEVKDDIEYSLKLINAFRITTGFDRPNLKFEVLRPQKKIKALLEILKRHEGDSGIIYCATRKAVEELWSELQKSGLEATMYHAGLEDDVRKSNQDDFVYDRKNIMVATNAFGMGIDKSNVSYVIHYNMPKDVESYYQEAGRAGRDGAPAECILLYSPMDVCTNRLLIDHSEPNPDLTPGEQQLLKERDYERLKQMTFYSTGNTCLRQFMLNYFGEKAPIYCGNCSNCQTQFQDVDVTVEAQKILSCIKRTGERYGKTMICAVLRGAANEQISRWGLDKQSTYGLMCGDKTSQIRAIIEHLEIEGYIESRGNAYPFLVLTPRANSVLFDNETVVMKQAKPQAVRAEKSGKQTAVQVADLALFAELKALRREIADGKNIPAYIVFSDATLVDMCKRRPATLEEMLQVSGVGSVKLELYGERFLQTLKTYYALEEARKPQAEEHERTNEDLNENPAQGYMMSGLSKANRPEREHGGRKAELRPFSITQEQLQNFEYSIEPIPASAIARRINWLVKEDIEQKQMRAFPHRNIYYWLRAANMIEWRIWKNGRSKRYPTALGEELGLVLHFRKTNGTGKPHIYFSEQAQRLIVDNIEAVLAAQKGTPGEDNEESSDHL